MSLAIWKRDHKKRLKQENCKTCSKSSHRENVSQVAEKSKRLRYKIETYKCLATQQTMVIDIIGDQNKFFEDKFKKYQLELGRMNHELTVERNEHHEKEKQVKRLEHEIALIRRDLMQEQIKNSQLESIVRNRNHFDPTSYGFTGYRC